MRSVSEQVKFSDVEPGAELAPASYPVTRLSLVRYCGAAGDFNVIHWNERIARSVGLPNVIAHGMFTMAEAGRYVTPMREVTRLLAVHHVLRRGQNAEGGYADLFAGLNPADPLAVAHRSRSAARSRTSSTTTAWYWR